MSLPWRYKTPIHHFAKVPGVGVYEAKMMSNTSWVLLLNGVKIGTAPYLNDVMAWGNHNALERKT